MIKHLVMVLISLCIATHAMEKDHRLTISSDVAKIIAEKHPAFLQNTTKSNHKVIIPQENINQLLPHINNRSSVEILNILYNNRTYKDYIMLLDNWNLETIKQFCKDYDTLGFTKQARDCVHFLFDTYRLEIYLYKDYPKNMVNSPYNLSAKEKILINKYCDSIDTGHSRPRDLYPILYKDGCLNHVWSRLKKIARPSYGCSQN